jgi:hypothetical protein
MVGFIFILLLDTQRLSDLAAYRSRGNFADKAFAFGKEIDDG